MSTSSPQVTPAAASEPEQEILYIGDSISANVDIGALQVATQSQFVTAKAYSSVHDTVSNVAKQAAKFPASNFTDVIPAQLKKGNYKCLILQAGSVESTNLNTKDNPEQHINFFRQETIMSATNLFNAAVKALKDKPSLKKVVILKQIPRYDKSDVDPLSLKSSLSILFNNTLTNLWMECPDRQKIVVGNHNIECSGAIRESRYRHTKTGNFDGIHLLGSSGSKAYTLSVLNILKSANVTASEHDFHLSCAQFQYQNRKQPVMSRDRKFKGHQKKTFRNAKVPTQNRFNRLRNMTQGNW